LRKRQFFIERALRRQSAKKGAETRRANRLLLEAAWGTPGTKKPVPDDELNDSLDDFLGND
jgi:hypothetical protein